MRRALFPSEVAASTPIGLSVPRFPAPHTLAAFSIRPRIRIVLSLQLSPLRVGCLRLAPVGTRFRLPLVTYLRQTRSGLYFARPLDVVEPTRLELVAS